MHFPKSRFVVSLWLAAAGLCATLGSARADDDVFQLPQDRGTVFRESGISDTDYVQFKKDGIYRRIVRAHMGVMTWDHGTWRQKKSGVVVLRSKEKVVPVRSGPLVINPETVRCLKAFQPLENDMTRFLARDTRQVYTAKEIKDAWRYAPWDIKISAVDIDKGTNSVTRKQVADLLGAWSKYLRSDIAEVTHVTPIAYKNTVVLVWHECDHTWWFPEEKPKTLDEKLKRVRELLKEEAKTGKPMGPTLYTRIDQREFESESQTTQPFLFFPEMNGRIQPGNPESDAKPEEQGKEER